MTISTQIFRFSYVSTGGTTYAYTNKILSENDLTVYVDDVLQTLSTHYTVSGVGEAAGGNVVFLVAPAAASVVLITKDGVEFTQETDYVENDAFPAESHENALDKLTNIAQKIWDYTRRSIKLPITSSLTDIELPTPEANKVIGWNAAADKLQNLALTGIGAISDEAYNSTTWDAVDEIAPSKNAVRDEFESMRATIISDFATAAEITTGTEAAKAIAPDQLALSSPTVVTVKCSGLTDLKVPKHTSDAVGLADTTITVTANNEVTNASQPAFLARVGTTLTNVVGKDATYTIILTTEVFDQNADYDNGTGVFTAPVTGRYQFTAAVYLTGATIMTAAELQLVTSNRTYELDYNIAGASANDRTLKGSALVDMDAGDTAYITVFAIGESANTVDVYGHASLVYTYFSGYLAC